MHDERIKVQEELMIKKYASTDVRKHASFRQHALKQLMDQFSV